MKSAKKLTPAQRRHSKQMRGIIESLGAGGVRYLRSVSDRNVSFSITDKIDLARAEIRHGYKLLDYRQGVLTDLGRAVLAELDKGETK